MTLRNLTTTFDEGRMRTWRLPRRSALTMLTRASFYDVSTLSGAGVRTRTETRTIVGRCVRRKRGATRGKSVLEIILHVIFT